jgi:hypothetical protein
MKSTTVEQAVQAAREQVSGVDPERGLDLAISSIADVTSDAEEASLALDDVREVLEDVLFDEEPPPEAEEALELVKSIQDRLKDAVDALENARDWVDDARGEATTAAEDAAALAWQLAGLFPTPDDDVEPEDEEEAGE